MARSLNLSGSGSLAPRGPGLHSVPMGDISVIPQAWTMRRPYLFSNPSIIDCGAADPPTIIVCSVFRFHLPGLQSSWSRIDRKSTRLNSSHGYISYAVFCLKKKKEYNE